MKGQVIAQAGEDLVRKLNSGTGPISFTTVYELLPLKGVEVVKVLEDGVDFQVSRYGTDPNNPYVYVAGVAFTLEAAKSKGRRIQNVKVKSGTGSYEPIDPEAVYKVVVNSFMAAGGDRYDTLKEAKVFMEYIKDKTLMNLAEERIEIKK